MKIKLITAAIICINVLMLIQDIPINATLITVASLLMSFFIKKNGFRNFFKIAIMIISMVFLRLHFKILLDTECAVSFALILSSLKFWELNEENDHFNMFLILSLCECCVFLLNPTFFIFAFGLLKVFFFFYYILKIRNYDVTLLNFKRLLTLIAPAIVLSLVLFFTFPRFTQGFLNSTDIQAMVGGNTKINFDQLGSLSTSDEPAFRVRGLENSNLPFKILYWRSSILWHLNNKEWVSSNVSLKVDSLATDNEKLKYKVESLQKYKEYLPILDGPGSVITANLNFNSYSDSTFKLKVVSRGNLNYEAIGTYGLRLKTITPTMITKGLKLKHPSEAIKKTYFEKASNSPNDEERLRELVKIFRNRDFEYSLTPPLYASVEDFLAKGKLGYCSHFAAGFTYLARLYNLPSRMVSGYLGGEFNPYDGSVLVRERDAHVWVEVFIEKKGWVKIDPTGLVAPARLGMSAQDFNNSLNPFITVLNFKINRELFNFAALSNFSLWLDSINSRFSSELINFDRDKQLSTLRAFTPKNFSVGWIFAISLTLCLGLFWIFFFYYGKKKIHPQELRYQRFLKKMNSLGVIKEPSETISKFQSRAVEILPEQKSYVDGEVSHYIHTFYM
ncbi:MAG: transglutaminaseTgpA domain-containing protein [Bdellovibrionales bacterium]|nr:transglutaminaseTgpA domain-containing protein [Bdellovibrionales bacterium]